MGFGDGAFGPEQARETAPAVRGPLQSGPFARHYQLRNPGGHACWKRANNLGYTDRKLEEVPKQRRLHRQDQRLSSPVLPTDGRSGASSS